MYIVNHSAARSRPPEAQAAREAGFTMMELMVSISILVLIILGVNLTFQGASKSVSLSQATMEMLANQRALQGIIESDVKGMDKGCFLVIRCLKENLNDPYARRFDQVSFISDGAFPNRTGNNSNAPFTDGTIANAAHIWIGQMVLEQNTATPAPSYVTSDQRVNYPMNGLSQPPTGAVSMFAPNGSRLANPGDSNLDTEFQFTVGRRANILVPGAVQVGALPNNYTVNVSGYNVPAYPPISLGTNGPYLSGIDYNVPAIRVGSEGIDASITSSRVAAANSSPSQIAQSIAWGRLVATTIDPLFEAHRYCYRSKSPATVFDSELNTTSNAYFRMNPITLQGVSSLQIDWTDGAIDTVAGSPTFGQLLWYGPDANTLNPNRQYLPHPKGDGTIERLRGNFGSMDVGLNALGDDYVATFSLNVARSRWPKALRFTYHVVDAQNRLKGGRDFTQVVKLPD